MWVDQWGADWQITAPALEDLKRRLGVAHVVPEPEARGKSEKYSSSLVTLEAGEKGVTLTRNNVGALLDERGVPVRYGLFNETKAVNEVLKSWDLVGWRPLLITPRMVGFVVGQFVGREIKHPGWVYTGAGREEAQMRCTTMALADGCDVGFATGRGTL